MQSLKSERAKKEYEQFVKEVTPKQNLFCNMAKAFIVGGLICVVGQILLHIGKTQFSLSKDDAGSWCSLILILSRSEEHESLTEQFRSFWKQCSLFPGLFHISVPFSSDCHPSM